MFRKISNIINLTSNMGIKYVLFRSFYEFKKRTGILQFSFPKSYSNIDVISLKEWQKSAAPFFFNSKDELKNFEISEQGKDILKNEFELIISGKFRFFSSLIYDLEKDYDWLTNPDSGYKYSIKDHWTKIPDFDVAKGDIKYVWEKSRFSFLHTIIRYDKHFSADQSEFVLNQITDWIDKNTLNMGPNYVCSQETSVRIMNWIFALYYYKNSSNLTEQKFQKILKSIYGQLKHVENNLNFSLIAVRNNHAITESLMLYLGGILFPFFKLSEKWKSIGKKHFQEEILYQIYDDGSYLQHSFNYQRVVAQLLTWAIILSKKNNDFLSDEVEKRAQIFLHFMLQMQDEKNGFLPNYGSNDGALFFPLSSSDYRDYRPQLNALHAILNGKNLYPQGDCLEDTFWLTGTENREIQSVEKKSSSFSTGGYFTLRNENKFTFIRCASFKDRPAQADNLHIDIWVDGINLVHDGGSYKYNADEKDVRYFMGTASHNTIILADFDQMQKGGRFIWYKWSEAIYAKIKSEKNHQIFEGEIRTFKHVSSNITHKRIVTQYFGENRWEITDVIENTNLECTQLWHLDARFFELGYKIKSMDKDGNEIKFEISKSYKSDYYGTKTESIYIAFKQKGACLFKTDIFLP